MGSLNGFGTALYGKSEKWPDGSYIATEWFIMLLLPIFPIASYRVVRGKTTAHTVILASGGSTEYQMTKVPLNWKQVRLTYFSVYGLLAAIISGLLLWLYINNVNILEIFGGFGNPLESL